MTVSKFEKIISRGNFLAEQVRFIPVKGLSLVTRLPLLRELLTNAVSCVLRIDSTGCDRIGSRRHNQS